MFSIKFIVNMEADYINNLVSNDISLHRKSKLDRMLTRLSRNTSITTNTSELSNYSSRSSYSYFTPEFSGMFADFKIFKKFKNNKHEKIKVKRQKRRESKLSISNRIENWLGLRKCYYIDIVPVHSCLK